MASVDGFSSHLPGPSWHPASIPVFPQAVTCFCPPSPCPSFLFCTSFQHFWPLTWAPILVSGGLEWPLSMREILPFRKFHRNWHLSGEVDYKWNYYIYKPNKVAKKWGCLKWANSAMNCPLRSGFWAEKEATCTFEMYCLGEKGSHTDHVEAWNVQTLQRTGTQTFEMTKEKSYKHERSSSEKLDWSPTFIHHLPMGNYSHVTDVTNYSQCLT